MPDASCRCECVIVEGGRTETEYVTAKTELPIRIVAKDMEETDVEIKRGKGKKVVKTPFIKLEEILEENEPRRTP